MPEERRDRQNLNLVTGTHDALSSVDNGHNKNQAYEEWFKNRWTRIGLAAQDKRLTFSNLMTHVNEETLKGAYKAIDGTKALGADGMNKTNYGRNLEENLRALAQRVASRRRGRRSRRAGRRLGAVAPQPKSRPALSRSACAPRWTLFAQRHSRQAGILRPGPRVAPSRLGLLAIPSQREFGAGP